MSSCESWNICPILFTINWVEDTSPWPNWNKIFSQLLLKPLAKIIFFCKTSYLPKVEVRSEVSVTFYLWATIKIWSLLPKWVPQNKGRRWEEIGRGNIVTRRSVKVSMEKEMHWPHLASRLSLPAPFCRNWHLCRQPSSGFCCLGLIWHRSFWLCMLTTMLEAQKGTICP